MSVIVIDKQQEATGRNYRWMIVCLLVLLAAAFIALRLFFAGSEWQLELREQNGRQVFEPHLQHHPGHLTLSQKVSVVKQIDLFNTLVGDRADTTRSNSETFMSMQMEGSPAPDFELRSVDGSRVSLSDNKGKISVFMFVAMTCPPARIQVPMWTDLAQKYNPDEVGIFLIYSRERHPGESGFPEFTQPSSDQQKFAYAKMMSQLTNLPVLVDGIGETVLNEYGNMMNPAFVVDADGVLVFRSTWADVNKIEEVVDFMLADS